MQLDLIKKELRKVIHLDDEMFQDFSKLFRTVRLEKGEFWIKNGRRSNYIGFVNGGILRQYVQQEGEEFIQNFFVTGDFMGLFSRPNKQRNESLRIQAIEVCELLVMPYERLQCLIGFSKNLEQFSNHWQTEKYTELDQMYVRLLAQTPEQRYRWLLSHKPEIINQVPQYYIAQYLGIKPETLSRIKKRA
ncbi:MAG: Crp/Fnr family transcriptional regulator [Bacteroidota bacterium]